MSSNVERIKAKHAAELAKAQLEDELTALLPNTGIEPSLIFAHELYGSVMSVRYGDPYSHGKMLTWEQALTIAKAYQPAERMYHYSGGFLSLRPLSHHIKALKEHDEDKAGPYISPRNASSCFEICPTLISWEAGNFGQPHHHIEWYSYVDGKLISLDVLVGGWLLHPKLGRYSARKTSHGDSFSWNCEVESYGYLMQWPAHLGAGKCIKWGRGSNDVQNRFTFCWAATDATAGPQPSEVIEYLMAK